MKTSSFLGLLGLALLPACRGVIEPPTRAGFVSVDGGASPGADGGRRATASPSVASGSEDCPAHAPRPVNRVRLYPASGSAASLAGTRIQGSDTGPTNDFVDLTTVEDPTLTGAYVEVSFTNERRYRYVKLYAAPGQKLRVAEIELYHDDTRLAGMPFGTASAAGGSGYARALDGDKKTNFESSELDGYVGLDLGKGFVVEAPTFSPPGGSFARTTSVSLSSATPGAVIRYTRDGSNPARTGGDPYDGPIALSNGRVTLKAVASADCLFDSPVAEATFTIGAQPTSAPSGPVRSYHVGNSLTDTINDWLEPIADSTGADHTYARWTIPGAPIGWIASHKGDGFGTPEGANNPDSFVRSFAPITHMSVQPFSDPSRETQGNAALSLLSPALAASPDMQVWVYAQWPSYTEWSKDGLATSAGWATPPWNVKAPANWEDAVANQVLYHEAFRQYVDDKLGGKEVLIVPAGPALVALKHAIESGKVPGMSDFGKSVFTDDLHLTPQASYLVGLVFYSCFYKQSAEGRASFAGTGLTDAQARILQRIAWETVSTYRWSGVAPR